MAEEQKKAQDVKSFDELKGKITKQEKVDTEEIVKQIATRNILERDYNEDLLEVVFNTSPGIRRKLQARKPTPKQMTTILQLNAKAIILGNRVDEKSVNAMTEIYKDLSDLAADLAVDKTLNSDFWFNKVSTMTLQNFIGELIRVTQQGPMTEKELSSFRK